ncbi:MAG: hypothetical protein PHP29_04160, partial [Tissierellia bacterium]|nr:hypothetical protein [Tissierellia bacterium]
MEAQINIELPSIVVLLISTGICQDSCHNSFKFIYNYEASAIFASLSTTLSTVSSTSFATLS